MRSIIQGGQPQKLNELLTWEKKCKIRNILSEEIQKNRDKIQIKYRQKYGKKNKEDVKEKSELKVEDNDAEKRDYSDSIHKNTKTREKYEQLERLKAKENNF